VRAISKANIAKGLRWTTKGQQMANTTSVVDALEFETRNYQPCSCGAG